MNLNTVWISCLLSLLTWIGARGCDWMLPRAEGSQSNFKVVSYFSIQALEEMGDAVTQQKSRAHMLSRFYEHTKNLHGEERIIFIHDVIDNIKELFINCNYDAVTWDQKTLQMIQLNLDRQASELKQCIRRMKSRPTHPSSYKKIKIHFKKMLEETRTTVPMTGRQPELKSSHIYEGWTSSAAWRNSPAGKCAILNRRKLAVLQR